MRTVVVLGCGAAALAVSGALGWNDVRHERDFRRLLAEGDRALTAGQTSVAVEAFSGAVALRPQSMLPYLKRGDTYLHRQEWDAAERDLLRASALDPTAPQPHERLGDVALGEGRFDDAARDYRASLALEDWAPGVLHKLALAQYQAGDHDAAARTADAALRLEPGRADSHYLRGLALVAGRRADDARRAFERAIALDPASVSARLALAALRNRPIAQEKRCCERLSPPWPRYTLGPLLGLADAYVRGGQPEQAEAALGARRRTPSGQRRDPPRTRTAARGPRQRERRQRPACVGGTRVCWRNRPGRPGGASWVTHSVRSMGQALLLNGVGGRGRAGSRSGPRCGHSVPVATFALLAEASSRRGHVADAAHARSQATALTVGPELTRPCSQTVGDVSEQGLASSSVPGPRSARAWTS